MMLALMRLAARAPLSILHAIGVALGWVAYCSKTYRRNLRSNLALAGYDNDRRLRRAAIGEAGKMFVEVPKIVLGPRDETLALVRTFNGREYIERARAEGKGIVYLTPHFGCFEVAGQALNELGPLTAAISSAEDRVARRAARAATPQAGRSSRARGPRRCAACCLAALKRGEAFIVLPDQVPGTG
jgi:KDO2-lipid IV(A) lauroyltransferase